MTIKYMMEDVSELHIVDNISAQHVHTRKVECKESIRLVGFDKDQVQIGSLG